MMKTNLHITFYLFFYMDQFLFVFIHNFSHSIFCCYVLFALYEIRLIKQAFSVYFFFIFHNGIDIIIQRCKFVQQYMLKR